MASTWQSPLIPIPFKRTEAVDFESPFNEYISTAYGDDPSKYSQEIGQLNRARQDMRGAGADVTGRDVLYRYYGQLELLDLRFPIDEKRVKILFTWYDAFTNLDTSQYSVAYEKACVIFNIGAVCSAIASKQNRFEALGQKTAYNYYQAAAGMFQYINDNFLHPPSVDLSRESIIVIVDLCLAQAQETFVEKVLGEKKKGALVAKLSAHCSHLYYEVYDGMQNPNLENHYDDSWEELMKIKAKFFQAMSHYHRALQLEAETNFGASVAHFNHADEVIKEANKIALSFSKHFQDDVGLLSFLSSSTSSSNEKEITAVNALIEMTKSLMNTIAEAKRIATKDNDVIYHEAVPAIETLEPIEKVSIVKSIPFAEICPNGQSDIPKIIGPDIFSKLIPLAVHESSSMYSEEKAKILRSEQARVESVDQEFEVTLQSVDLVATVGKLKNIFKGEDAYLHSSCCLPGDLKKKIENLQQSEITGTSVSEILGILESMKEKIKESISKLPLVLDKEQHEYENFRVKYGAKWPQTPSSNLTQRFRQDLKQHKDAFNSAHQADLQLLSQWNTISKQVEVLKQPLEYIESSMFQKVSKALEVVSPAKQVSLIDTSVEETKKDSLEILGEEVLYEKIDNLLNKLRSLKSERSQILIELKNKIHSEDISQVLLINKGRESQVFQSELAKFKPLQLKITENISSTRKLLSEVVQDVDRLKVTSKGAKILHVQEKVKKELVQQWQDALSQWMKTKENLQKGIEFYDQLSDLFEKLKNNIDSFVDQRSEECKRLVQSLESQQAKESQQSLKEQLERLSITSPSNPHLVNQQHSNVYHKGNISATNASSPASPTSAPLSSNPHLSYPALNSTVSSVSQQYASYPSYSQHPVAQTNSVQSIPNNLVSDPYSGLNSLNSSNQPPSIPPKQPMVNSAHTFTPQTAVQSYAPPPLPLPPKVPVQSSHMSASVSLNNPYSYPAYSSQQPQALPQGYAPSNYPAQPGFPTYPNPSYMTQPSTVPSQYPTINQAFPSHQQPHQYGSYPTTQTNSNPYHSHPNNQSSGNSLMD